MSVRCLLLSLMMASGALRLAAAEATDAELIAARTALAAVQERIAAERKAMSVRLGELARDQAVGERELAALAAQAGQQAVADPAPERRELARFAAALAGSPAGTLLADSLGRWRDEVSAKLRAATTVTVGEAPVTWWDGSQARTRVTRLGAAGAAVSAPVPALVVPLGDGWRQAGPAITARAAPGWIPVDVTGKLAALTTTAAPTAWSRLRAGGWSVVPIIAAGLIALALVIERLLSFRHELGDEELGERVVGQVGRGEIAVARALVAAPRTPTARVLAAGLAAYERGFEARAAALGAAILAETPRIERSLTILGMLAAIAPLLGLLGTVSGMITMFQVLSAHGTGNPKLLSGGISECLIATLLGLMVAVPVLFAHALLARRAERTLTRIEELATALASSHALPAPAAPLATRPDRAGAEPAAEQATMAVPPADATALTTGEVRG